MEQWVKSARAKLVPMSSEFLDKPEAEDRPFGSVVKDMKPDYASVEILVCPIFFEFYFHPALNQRRSHSYPHDHDRSGDNPSECAESDDVQQPLPY